MKKMVYYIFFAVVLCCFFSGQTFSQTTYSLFELTQIADKQSETIKIAEEDLYKAEQEKQRALSVIIPRVTTYVNGINYNNERAGAADSVTIGIKLTQSFTLNGKELIALDVTKRSIEGKQFSLDSIRNQYLFQVAQAYYNILSTQRFNEIAQSDVKRLTAYRDSVQEKLNVGNVTKADLFRSEAELSKSFTEQVKAENSILQSKAALQNLVLLDANFDLIKEDIREIENFECTLENIQSIALQNRPEIKESKKNLEIFKKTIRFSKSDYWPSVSLELGYRETDSRYDAGQIDVETDNEDAYISGELVFTLFDGGLRKATIRQAMADYRKAKLALELNKKQIILDSKISFSEYQTAKSTLLNLQDELKSAQENYNAVQMQFKYGMADSINIMDANTLLVTSQRRISYAKYAYYLTVLKILYTKGGLTSFFLNSVSR